MTWLTGWALLTGMALSSGALAQAPAMAPVASAAASAVMHVSMACAPEMPRNAAKANAQGTSRVRFHVDETGNVTGAEITGSAGRTHEHRMLDAAAMHALARCPVVPARDLSGQPVASDVDVSYTWKLD